MRFEAFCGRPLSRRGGCDKVPSVAQTLSYGLYSGQDAGGRRRRMPPSDLRVPVEAIRREAELARDASSLRAVARDIGLTAMGLRSFLLDERTPQARTLRKLTSWYGRRMSTRPPEGEDEARAALTILAGYFPERERRPQILEVLDSMERRFAANGMRVPDWLHRLRREVQGDDD